jgi:hypothetical protein
MSESRPSVLHELFHQLYINVDKYDLDAYDKYNKALDDIFNYVKDYFIKIKQQQSPNKCLNIQLNIKCHQNNYGYDHEIITSVHPLIFTNHAYKESDFVDDDNNKNTINVYFIIRHKSLVSFYGDGEFIKLYKRSLTLNNNNNNNTNKQ